MGLFSRLQKIAPLFFIRVADFSKNPVQGDSIHLNKKVKGKKYTKAFKSI